MNGNLVQHDQVHVINLALACPNDPMILCSGYQSDSRAISTTLETSMINNPNVEYDE